MFEGASHFIARDVTQNNHFSLSPDTRNDQAMKELYAHVAPSAMHTSAARVDAPKCHEETREAVQQDMSSWTQRPSASGEPQVTDDILWLTGPAGTGKTAIMGTVSDKLEVTGQLIASFYFSASMGAAGTTSKRFFVSTLAYQMAVHPSLKERLAPSILSAVRESPGVFDMSLNRQLEVLILQPLRLSQRHPGPGSLQRTSILVDGVDECEEPGDAGSSRSRQEDQVEVLSVLRQAVNDPAFPFCVIIASRPEIWIRRYFDDNAAGKVHEIFLDEKYSPDDDIKLFLKSKFAEMCRRCGLDPSTWPSEDDIAKLVEDASGQFIYVATVLRFIDTPGSAPQEQLDIVLNLKINPRDSSNPFAMLDALYSSILRSNPKPDTTVLWLKGVLSVQNILRAHSLVPSKWTIDRLLESHAGQAQILLGSIPSLCYTRPSTVAADSDRYGEKLIEPPSSWPSVGWTTQYAFYHKSFLDYLERDSRCGIVFPHVGEARVDAWLSERFGKTLKCGGPEVPVPAPLLMVFQRSFLDLLVACQVSGNCWRVDSDILSACEPNIWLDLATQFPSVQFLTGISERRLYILVHNTCRSYRPCNPGCKRWRRAISGLSNDRWRQIPNYKHWSSVDTFLDRFKIKALNL